MNSFLSVIDATRQSTNLKPLTSARPAASIPIYGKYRIIDFTLSCCYHADCKTVGVLTNKHAQSLYDHFKSGKDWGLDLHKNGLFILSTPTTSQELKLLHLQKHFNFFKRSKQSHVVIMPGYTIISVDLQNLVDQHTDLNSDFSQITYDNKPTEIYLFKRCVLIELLTKHINLLNYSLSELVNHLKNFTTKQIALVGNYHTITSIEQYYHTSMNFLNNQTNILTSLNKYGYLVTKDYNLPPTLFKNNSSVKNSIILSNCIIEGTIHNSILANKVLVAKNSYITNSIIFSNVIIHENVTLEFVIVDKNVIIEKNTTIKGSLDNIIYIKKDSLVKE